MAMKRIYFLLVACLGLALLYSPRPLFSSGPFFPSTVFTYTLHPEFPLERFAQGELGVLQPTYARSYLAVAYRYLSGVGLNPEEQQAMLALWQERLKREWNPEAQGWISQWLNARNSVPGVSAQSEIDNYRRTFSADGTYFLTYLNCPVDAFRSAASTLEKRIAQFGADSAVVRDWVAAQDQVFANCSQGHSIPAPASSDLPPLLQADRAYQVAAAHFYVGNYDAAKEQFAAIARDASSPWRRLAPYLLARTLLRQALLGVGPGDGPNKALLAQAAAQAETLLRDSTLAEMHPAAERLLNHIRARLDPAEQLHRVAQSVVQKNAGASLKQSVWDYTFLLDTFLSDPTVFSREENYRRMAQNFAIHAALRGKDDVTDWILTFQGAGKVTGDYALQKWNETDSLPWLIALLTKIDPAHPQVPALLDTAEKIPPNSPAFLTAVFHRARLLIETGRKDQARDLLDGLLSARTPELPLSTRNLLLALRMPLARDLDEWLTYAQRVPTEIFYDSDGLELPMVNYDGENEELKAFAGRRAFFDSDATQALNVNLPLSLWVDAVTSKVLPDHLRRELALAAWVRAAVLEDAGSGEKLAPTVANLVPALRQSLETYQTADSNEARRFAAVLLMLRFPGTRPYIGVEVSMRLTSLEKIDSLRDNWWCAATDPSALDLPNFFQINRGAARTLESDELAWTAVSATSQDLPDFLGQTQQNAAKEEWQRLVALGAAPNYLSQQVLEWAQKNPADSRLPEALHLAVRATRYGCTDGQTSGLSKRAFQLLHRRYPNSTWAKKTPYWF